MDQVRAFVEGTAEVAFSVPSRAEGPACIAETPAQCACRRLGRRDKGLLVRCARLAGSSVSHPYNPRRSRACVGKRGHVTKTRPVQVQLGERRVPQPEGRPGFPRVDSLHSGDWDGVKGLYVIKLVGEVAQYQLPAPVPRFNEGNLGHSRSACRRRSRSGCRASIRTTAPHLCTTRWPGR